MLEDPVDETRNLNCVLGEMQDGPVEMCQVEWTQETYLGKGRIHLPHVLAVGNSTPSNYAGLGGCRMSAPRADQGSNAF